MFSVVQCNRCAGPLHVVSSYETDWRCPTCRQLMPLEAFRWLGHGMHRNDAVILAHTWNDRLERGLSWTEEIEFKHMVPT